VYHTEFGINLKLVCALDFGRGLYALRLAFSFSHFRIIVRLVTFCSPDIIPYDCRLFYLDSEGRLSGMVVVVFMEHVG